MAEAYFDESASELDNVFCVAGYLYRPEDALSLKQKWTTFLAGQGIRCFHMKDCAHGNGEFSSFTKQERVVIQTSLFDILKQHLAYGVSVSFDMRYRHMLPSAKMHGIKILSSYALCCYFCMMTAKNWAESTEFAGQIAYFFESGHSNMAEASRIMEDIFAVPELKRFYRHGKHTFADKTDAVLLQTADILAWQWRKNVVERNRGNKKPRADLWSLLERPHYTIHFDERTI